MAKIFKTGNSLAVTVPARFVQALGLKAGDNVKVEFRVEKGRVHYQFGGIRQLPLVEDLILRSKKKRRA